MIFGFSICPEIRPLEPCCLTMEPKEASLSSEKHDLQKSTTCEPPKEVSEDTVSLEHFLIGRSRQVSNFCKLNKLTILKFEN